MSAQNVEQAVTWWPQVNETVWVVHHHHTWDAEINNDYFPVPRRVLSVDVDAGIIHLEYDLQLKRDECFVSQEDCRRACPAPHPDD